MSFYWKVEIYKNINGKKILIKKEFDNPEEFNKFVTETYEDKLTNWIDFLEDFSKEAKSLWNKFKNEVSKKTKNLLLKLESLKEPENKKKLKKLKNEIKEQVDKLTSLINNRLEKLTNYVNEKLEEVKEEEEKDLEYVSNVKKLIKELVDINEITKSYILENALKKYLNGEISKEALINKVIEINEELEKQNPRLHF